jgi:hypothetical protein
MTQIYQHEEDSKRGDRTLSFQLGIKGTFYFTAAFFSLAVAGFVYYFTNVFEKNYSPTFLAMIGPVLVYFLYWFFITNKDLTLADFKHTMLLNIISASCLNVFFIYLFLDSSQVIQAIQGGF